MPAILNAANEIAVASFLDSQIRFTAIPEVIDHCMNQVSAKSADSIDQVLEADRLARDAAAQYIARL